MSEQNRQIFARLARENNARIGCLIAQIVLSLVACIGIAVLVAQFV